MSEKKRKIKDMDFWSNYEQFDVRVCLVGDEGIVLLYDGGTITAHSDSHRAGVDLTDYIRLMRKEEPSNAQ